MKYIMVRNKKIDYDKYKNTLEYPKRPSKPKEPRMPKGTTDPNVISLYADEMKEYAEVMKSHAVDVGTYKDEMKASREEGGRLQDEFKKDALEEVGLTGHKKAEKAWDFAWEKGHSAGYYEVYYYLDKVSDLILD